MRSGRGPPQEPFGKVGGRHVDTVAVGPARM
jgi:hypothetical protein